MFRKIVLPAAFALGAALVNSALSTGMARLSPDEIAEKWSGRTAAAAPAYVAGVERVTESPGRAAAQKVDKYVAGLQANVNKWADRVGSVSLEDWKQSTVEKGGARYAQGAQAGAGKMAAFQREFQPFQDRVVEAAKRIDDTTLEGRINKAAFVMRETAKFRKGR